MQTVNNNKPEQINSALFSISDDITKQNIQTKNAIKSSEAAMQKQIDKLTDSLKNNGGLITGGTYNINISGNASTATKATNATNADKATQDSAGNTIATTYATKTEVPTKTSQLTNDSGYITSSGSITGNAATAGNADTVDNYHASQLWRSDGATWNPGANVAMTPSGNNSEWSFDFANKKGTTGAYWHVWDENKHTLLKVDADSGKVSAPYGFVGNLAGKADTSGTADKVASIGDSSMWIHGRALAICKATVAGEDGGWKALASIKTASGSYEIGNLAGEDFIRIVYSSDANVNSGTNDVTQVISIKNNAIICFPKIDATPAGIRIPTSRPSSVLPGDIWIE